MSDLKREAIVPVDHPPRSIVKLAELSLENWELRRQLAAARRGELICSALALLAWIGWILW